MNRMRDVFKQTICELNSYIQEIVEAKQDPFGLSIAITNDEGIIWTEGYGFTNHTKTEQVTPDTLFSTQSMGKCFTATLFLTMASKNMVHLDDPIRAYYPEFKINTIFGSPDQEIEKITFRRLLSHTAGLTHEALVGNNYDYQPCSFEEHIDSISKGWLKSPVGSEMSYSNLGYDLTAYVMGLIHEKTFPEVMSEELFKPLEIVNATFDINEAKNNSFAQGYDGSFQFPIVQIPMLGAGGLFISAREIARFIAFHLRKGENDGVQMIGTHLLEDMYRPQQPGDREFGYGLGLYTSERIAEAKVYGHGGGGYGYQTNMMWIPDLKIGVIVLSNNMKQSYVGGIAKKALELMAEDVQKITPSPSVPDVTRLSGTFVADGNLSSQLLRIFSRDGKLFAIQMDGSVFELVHEKGSTFKSPVGITCEFELDAAQNPKSIFIDGLPFPFKAKFNDGPFDEVGPNKDTWKAFVGIYQYEEDGRPAYLSLNVFNGYLYITFLDNLKLFEHHGDVFFTADGEILTVHDDTVIYKGITAKKESFDKGEFLKDIEKCSIKYDYYHLTVASLLPILYLQEGIHEVIDFIGNLVKIDERFKTSYTSLGKRLLALGRYKDATLCLKALEEIDPEDREVKAYLERINQISGK